MASQERRLPTPLSQTRFESLINPEDIPVLNPIESRILAYMPRLGDPITRFELGEIMAVSRNNHSINRITEKLSKKFEPQHISIKRFINPETRSCEWVWKTTIPECLSPIGK